MRIRYSSFTWTPTQIAFLLENWNKKSATEIGSKIKKSRSAVLGKVRRLGLKK